MYRKLVIFLAVIAGARQDFTLPSTVIPNHYSVTLHLDPNHDHYNGSVIVTFTTSSETNQISLHASPANLKITKITLISNELNSDTQSNKCNANPPSITTEIVNITCTTKLDANKQHELSIHFKGKYSMESIGIFKARYKEKGVIETIVQTQFEATYARRAFPCFDEPELKARFKMTIHHPKEYNAIGNTAVVSNLTKGNVTVTEFKTTPMMSTYLLAFVVSKFVSTEPNQPGKFNFAIFSRPSAKKFTGTALKYSPLLSSILEDFTNISYVDLGDNKMDMIALPEKFDSGMENWGLITYSELEFLDEGERTTAQQKQNIISLVAHELAHQWFGDYVTCTWWSDLWLNEGFATYFQYTIPDMIEDLNLEMSKQFIIDIMSSALEYDSYFPDSLSNDKSDVVTQSSIKDKFDEISYSKGASVIRMLEGVMGSNNFKNAIRTFLRNNKQGTNTPLKLFKTLQNYYKGKGDLIKMFDSFIYKSGYPLLTTKLVNENLVQITQEPFYHIKNEETTDLTWNVPVSYTTSNKRNFDVISNDWIDKNGFNITIENGEWVILNLQRIGYYRVNYDETLWKRIISELKGPNMFDINVLNRAQLIDDVFNVAKTGQVTYKIVFNLCEYLKNETEYYPWAVYFNGINYLMWQFSDDSVTKNLLQKVTLNWIKTAFPDFVSNSTSHIDILRDSLINKWKCKLGDEECLNYVKNVFTSLQNGQNLENTNDRFLVYCNAFQTHSDPKQVYEYLIKKIKESDSDSERDIILKALACSKGELQKRYLKELIADEPMNSFREAGYITHTVVDEDKNSAMNLLDFLNNHGITLHKKYKSFVDVDYLFFKIAEKSNDDKALEEVLDKFESEKIIDDEYDDILKDFVKLNTGWKKSFHDVIKYELLTKL